VNGPESGTVSQTIAVPTGATATLNFYLRIGEVASPFTDVLNIKIDGTTVLTIAEPGTPESSYTLRSVNLNAYANGGLHTVLFEYLSPSGGGVANFNLDDVTLDVVCSQSARTYGAGAGGVLLDYLDRNRREISQWRPSWLRRSTS
jgi:hypothetical protein